MAHLFRRFSLLVSLCLLAAFPSAVPSSGSGAQSQPDTSKPAAQSAPQTPAPAKKSEAQDQDKDSKDKDAPTAKKKPKKVWTNEEISTVGGTISVVGDSSSSSAANSSARSASNSSPNNQVESYRDQLRQLRAQLDATDKKINDLRNFKADNSSPAGGIDPRHGYSMTPVEDQIKQLEAKKKQIQDKIEALEDEARKKGIEPGQLR